MLFKNKTNYHVLFFLILIGALNITQSVTMDLTHDEAYYWVYSLFPSWGYYDHPPMVGWMIWLGTVFGKSEFLVRLPFNLMQLGSIWLMWELGGKKSPIVFYTTILTFPLILAGGFLALPDTPLMFFSLLFWKLTDSYVKKEQLWHIPAIAFAIACLFYSKYHGLIVVLFTTAAMPFLLKRKSFWGIVLLTVLFFLPHLQWQMDNDFVSLALHFTKRAEKHFDVMNVLDYLGSQIALGGFFLFFVAIFAAIKKGKQDRNLLFNSVGFFAFILLLSLRNKIEANWTVTAFAALTPLVCIAAKATSTKKILIYSAIPGIVLIFILRGMLAWNYPLNEYPIERLGEIKGWKYRSKLIHEKAGSFPLYADTYQLASKLSFYGNEVVPSLALSSRESQFSLLNLESQLKKDDRISYIGPDEINESLEIELGYGDEGFLVKDISFGELLNLFGKSDEEVIRN